MRRIAFISPFDEPLSGADESLLLLLRHLDRSRYEPLVFVPPGSQYIAKYESTGTRVIRYPLSRLRRTLNPFYWLEQTRRLFAELRDWPKILTSERIDLLHLNMHVLLGPLVAANRLDIPVVVHYRAKTNDRPAWFFDFYLPWLHRRSTRIVAISRMVASHFTRRGLADRVDTIPNPIDLVRLNTQASGDRFADSPQLKGKKVILFVGRIHPQKRIDILLDAMAFLGKKRSDVAAAIVGEEAHESDDRSYAAKLRSRASASDFPVPVLWYGAQTDVASYMRSATLLVLPSVNEGFGRVLVEAMACGTRVIGARSGAIPEVLEEGRWGRLVLPDRPDLLAAEIDAALNDPRSDELALIAKEHALSTYAPETHANRIMELYDTISKPHRSF